MDSKPSLTIASFTLTCNDEGKSLTRGWVGNSDPCCSSWWATIINAASTVEAGLFKFPFTALYFLWGGYQIWGPGECKHPLLSVTVEQRLNAVTSKHGRYLPETRPGRHPSSRLTVPFEALRPNQLKLMLSCIPFVYQLIPGYLHIAICIG